MLAIGQLAREERTAYAWLGIDWICSLAVPPTACLQTFGVAVMYSYGGSVGNYQYLIEVSGLTCRVGIHWRVRLGACCCGLAAAVLSSVCAVPAS